VTGRFDLIIGSDLLYERDVSGALAGFIGRHAMPRSEVWIVDPDRSNRSAFNRLMREQGFDLKESRLDQAATAHALAYKGRLLTYVRSGSQRSSSQARG
jgi:predicted nicotinamide N-methyase